MTQPENHPEKVSQPIYENGTPYPVTVNDWTQRAAELEAERDIKRAQLIDEGICPQANPVFAHLLGSIGIVHEQIIAMRNHEIEENN